MSDKTLPEDTSLFVDRHALLRALAEVNAATGFVPDDTGTIQEVRAQMVAEGVRPEDNEGTRDMLAARYPHEGC